MSKENPPLVIPPDPFILQTLGNRTYRNITEHAHAYPKNSRERLIVMPVETKTQRFLDVRNWYPSPYFKGLYRPGKGIEIVAEETCQWLIETLTAYQNWIVKSPFLAKLTFPSKEIPFQVADQETCDRAFSHVFGEKGEHLAQFRDFLSTQDSGNGKRVDKEGS